MKTQKILRCVIVLSLLFTSLAASAQFGDVFKKTMDRAKRAKDTFQPWTPEEEAEIGRSSAAKMIHVFGLYNNPEMGRYVNLVGDTLALQTNRPMQYHFAILDTDIVSAYAMPGGFVFITKGGLANMTSEAELAGVLAHEIAHVENRHLEKEVRTKKATGWVYEESTAKLKAPQELKNIGNHVVESALTSSYSRDKEDEADRRGLEIASAAGYDASGLRNFLQVLAAASADPQNAKRLNAWTATHPPYAARVAELNTMLAGKSGGAVLDARFKQSVNFTPPAAEAPAAVPAPGAAAVAAVAAAPAQNPCTLAQAKQRIAYEREQIAILGTAKKATVAEPPATCSYEDAKTKIEQVDKEIGAPAATPAKPHNATKPAPKAGVKK